MVKWDRTVTWYDTHAETVIARTASIDFRETYQKVLHYIKPGGRILDVGSGSCRDAKAFEDLGYDVFAMDASKVLAEHGSKILSRPVIVRDFHEVREFAINDLVWANASLLHVPKVDLPGILQLLEHSLVTTGYLYFSLKKGSGEHDVDGKFYAFYDPDELVLILASVPKLTLVELWETADQQGRSDTTWINVLARVSEDTPEVAQSLLPDIPPSRWVLPSRWRLMRPT
jgi:SAM-dependent methyltransferase